MARQPRKTGGARKTGTRACLGRSRSDCSTARPRAGDLRRRVSVRVRAARISAGGRLCAGDRARSAGSGGVAPPRVRPRGLGCGRGLHLLRPPRQAADGGPRGRPRQDQSHGASHRQEGRAEHRHPLAGDICSTSIYDPSESKSHKQVRRIFDEQIRVGGRGRASTSSWPRRTRSEARPLLALEAIRQSGRPAVVTLAIPRDGTTREAGTWPMRAADSEAGGAGRGRPQLRPGTSHDDAAAPGDPRRRLVSRGRVAGSLPDDGGGAGLPEPDGPVPSDNRAFPTALDPFLCNRYEIAEFGKDALALDVRYLGVCCGAGPHHIRSLAEALGPPAAREPLLAGHVQHILLRQRQAVVAREPRYGRQTYGAARAMRRAHLLRWRPRQPRLNVLQNVRARRLRHSSAPPRTLDPSHRSSRISPTGS